MTGPCHVLVNSKKFENKKNSYLVLFGVNKENEGVGLFMAYMVFMSGLLKMCNISHHNAVSNFLLCEQNIREKWLLVNFLFYVCHRERYYYTFLAFVKLLRILNF